MYKGHLLKMGRKEPGQHKGSGRIDTRTGEYLDEQPEQEQETQQMAKTEKSEKPEVEPKPPKPPKPKKEAKQATQVFQEAMEIKFVPKTYTTTLSPTLTTAYRAAQQLWGWDMEIGEFIDTVIYRWFKIKGVTLAGFLVEETPEQREKRLQALGNNGDSPQEEAEEVANASAS